MSLLVFLNELSYRDTDARHEEITSAIHGLVALLREVRRHRADTALVSEVAFMDLDIGAGFSMRQWEADGRNRDSVRFIRAMRNRAPFSSVLADQEHDLTEYTHVGRTAYGLGWAHLSGGLAASLALSPTWDGSRLLLRCCALAENDVGDVVLEYTDEEVRHASRTEHVAEHRQWIYQTGVQDIHTGAELWRLREDIFPRLRFLPRVAQDLEGLRREWVRPAKELLSRLQEATEAWDPGQDTTPTWPTKVTPEHEQRRRLCWFDDPVAGRALFDLHARLTPGAGRLHFRWDPDKGEVIIGYVGRKLE
ncbi:MAG TPA: hypothetical protein VFB84_14025 [Micromonosporaceae bacterium]|nr:hypothetical protein [Micromonosporaceae bacterium]